MNINEIKNKKNIAILGFGREGESSLKFLSNIWCDWIDILDKKNWENYLDNLDSFDLIIKTPWISAYNKKIIPHKNKIISQAQIFFSNYKGKVIWITATKGKSTISTIIYELLKKAWYNVKLIWNIGKPVLAEIDLEKDSYDYIVYELSSYMLEDLEPNLFIWILWNIYPDHLDWHLNFKNYKKAKLNILKNSENILVNSDSKEFINENDNINFFWNPWKYNYKNWSFFIENKNVFNNKEIQLKWEHNMINICSVLWICDIIWIKTKVLEDTLKDFSWLAHRLENVWIYKKITFINDSISTTPESTIEAIKTFKENIWTIFLWWTDRWYNFTELIKYLEKYSIKNIVLFPESWKKIKSLLKTSYNIFFTNSMKKAIDFAFKNTESWKICLLSCASPSYSLWKDFEEKWNEFKEELKKFVT